MRDLYVSSEWKLAVSAALGVLLLVVAMDILAPNSPYHDLLVVLDFGAIGVLAANLAMGYYHATYKDVFLKQHAIELLALIPLWGMLRLAEYDYLLIRLFRTTSHFGLFEDAG